MMLLLPVARTRSLLCIVQRQRQGRAINASIPFLPKQGEMSFYQSVQHHQTLSWQNHQTRPSMHANNSSDNTNNRNDAIIIIGIQTREENLLEMLEMPQLNQEDVIIQEFQSILLYYCNKVTLHKNNKNNDIVNVNAALDKNGGSFLAAQNICKWTQVLLRYIQEQQQKKNIQENNTTDGVISYSHVPWEPIVEALSCTQQVSFLMFAHDLVLNLAATLHKEPQTALSVDVTKLMSCLISGWSKCDSANANCEPAEKAEYWLLHWVQAYYHHTIEKKQKQNERKENGTAVEFPKVLLFGAVIDSWAKATKRDAPFRAERILNLLLSLFEDSVNSEFSRINDSRQVQKESKPLIVTSLIEEEKPLFHFSSLLSNKTLGKLSVPRPNTVLYTSIIDAWSRSSHPKAATYAEQWLHHMEKEYFEHGNSGARPNVVSYTAVISAFVRCSSYPQKNNNVKSSSSPHAANRAESVMLRLLQLSSRERSTNDENHENGSTVQHQQQLAPDVIAYNSVVSAWANMVGKDPWATRNSERWLTLMLEGGAEADAVSFNSVINAYAREATFNGSKAARRAEYWFMDMKARGIEPTIITYGSLIKAWSNSKSHEAPERAEFWLQAYHQQHHYHQQQQQDSIVVYNSVVNAWISSGRSDALDGAVRLISQMEQFGSKSQQQQQQNRIESSSISTSSSTTLRLAPPPPDVITYNTLLKGCSTIATASRGKINQTQTKAYEMALRVAFKTYNIMLSSSSSSSSSFRRDQPDSHTFSIMLAFICRCTLNAEKKKNSAYKDIVAKIFHDCCNRGMVNDFVLSALKNACSFLSEEGEEGMRRAFYTELTTANSNDRTGDINIFSDDWVEGQIPLRWKMNVRAGESAGRSHGAPTERAMLLSRQKKTSFRGLLENSFK